MSNSKLAVFDGKKAIRGGIPFVFRKYSKLATQIIKLAHNNFKFYTFIQCVNLRVVAQFGPSSFGPQHGFARISRWTLERAPERLHNGDIEALFSLMDSEFTRSMWNFPLVSFLSFTVFTIR